MNLVSLHSIPPFISSVLLFLFFLVGLFKGKERKENLLFSLVCLLGFFLNLDKTLLTFVEDEKLALKISRIDHLFLVFIIPLYLHFTLAITGKKEFKTLLKVLYALSLLMVPLTQTDYYLEGVRRFFFGFFAKAGPLFYFFATLSGLSVLLSIFILVRALKSEKSALRRTKIKYVILSVGVAAFINHFDILVMSGFNFYPFGNFVFLPMALLGYAIYRHDILEWKIFLNRGLQFFVLLLFSAGVYLAFLTIFENLFGKNLSIYVSSFFAFVPTLALILVFSERIREWVKSITLRDQMVKRKVLKDLSFSVLKIESAQELKDIVLKELKETFGIERCLIVSCEKRDVQPPKLLDEKDPLWNKGYRLSISIPSSNSPSLLLLGEKRDMSLYTEEEIELLSILGNNLALAMDNAYIYKKLKDFTESLERIVEERTRALIRSESLAAVGRLAAGVAHELNNPLASVMSTLEYHLGHIEEKGALYEDLEFCLRELKRAEGIVRSLLSTARQKDEEKRPVDIHMAIEDALRILYNEYKRKPVIIEKFYRASSPYVLGVQGRLCQVFVNLIKNGLEALGEEGGILRIVTENLEDRVLRVTVEDNGMGMDEETKANLFKPFFTTKHQGVGLGLYITYEIIRDHSGEIEVESKKGKGTLFILSFPAYQQLS